MAREPSALTKMVSKLMPAVHRNLYVWTNGRIGRSMPQYGPILLLTTTGRHSGQPRTTPLMYVEHEPELMVIGLNGGLDTHPDWYWNLTSDPAADVQIGPEKRAVRARVAVGDERSRLWADLVERFPGYGSSAERTEREIPLVLLAPVLND